MYGQTGSTVLDMFNPCFEKPVTFIVCAPRGSGKSVLLADILYRNILFYSDLYIFAGSDAVYNDFKDKVPPSRIKRGYSDENMSKVMETAKQTTELLQGTQDNGKEYQVAIILDDLGFDKRIFKSTVHLEMWYKHEIHTIIYTHTHTHTHIT
jgi:hypothetical protein